MLMNEMRGAPRDLTGESIRHRTGHMQRRRIKTAYRWRGELWDVIVRLHTSDDPTERD